MSGDRSAADRAYREANPERIAEIQRIWYVRNRERVRVEAKASYAIDPEPARARARAYYAANKERLLQSRKEYKKRWLAENAEKDNARRRRWYAENPGKGGEYSRSRRARIAGAPVVERIDSADIIARDRSVCHLCRKRVPKREITLDHLIPLALGGDHTAANLAVAHRRCNSSKGIKATNEQLRIVG